LTRQSPGHKKITLWQRPLFALISAIFASIFCLLISFVLIRTANDGSDTSTLVLNVYWNGSLAFIALSAILGFAMGGTRMAHFTGIIFRTNNSKTLTGFKTTHDNK